MLSRFNALSIMIIILWSYGFANLYAADEQGVYIQSDAKKSEVYSALFGSQPAINEQPVKRKSKKRMILSFNKPAPASQLKKETITQQPQANAGKKSGLIMPVQFSYGSHDLTSESKQFLDTLGRAYKKKKTELARSSNK